MAQSLVQTNPDTTTLESQSQFGTILESQYGVGSGSGEGLRRKVPVDNTGTSLEEDLEKVVADAVTKLQLVEEKEKEHFCKVCRRSVDICDCRFLKGDPSDCRPYVLWCSYCGASVWKRPSKLGEDSEGCVNAWFRLQCVNKGEQWANNDGYNNFDPDFEDEFLSKDPDAED